jgi:RNA polymerase primary sigma factor
VTGRRGAGTAHLDAVTERRLVRAARRGDERDRDEFVAAFMPLIASIAHLYRGTPGVDRDELVQEGVVGLLRALQRFDLAAGTSFRAYAAWWVRQAMQQLTAELARPIVLSDRALRQLARVKGAQHAHLQRDGREGSTAELSHATGIGCRQIQRLVAAGRPARGLDEPVGDDGGGGGTLAQILPDPAADDPCEHAVSRVASLQIPRLLSALAPRERRVIVERFGLGVPERTLRQIGDDLGVSVERVRQIEQASLAHMRLIVCPS